MSALGLQRSNCFLGGREFPRIVLPILDLIGKDPEWSNAKLTMEDLLTNSLSYQATKKQFHPSFIQNQDIVEGLQDYHLWYNLSYEEFSKNEDLLLQIISNYLQRQIIFHAILKPTYGFQNGRTFGDTFTDKINILGYRRHSQSFFISATKQ